MKRKARQRSGRGFTLIELMIAVAIAGIFAVILPGIFMNARKLSEDHVLFTRATEALSLQAEKVKAAGAMGKGSIDPAPEVKALVARLPKGKATIEAEPFESAPGMVRVDIKIGWDNAWEAHKSLHTVVVRKER